MSHPPLELVEILKLLARRRVELKDIRCNTPFGQLTDQQRAAEREWEHALRDVITWIHQRTGIGKPDLWEAAHRVGTPFGLDARSDDFDHDLAERWEEWVRKGRTADKRTRRARKVSPLCFAKLIGYEPVLKQYRDLTWILPQLSELDRTGTTVESLPLVLLRYPAVAVELGIKDVNDEALASVRKAIAECGRTAKPNVVLEHVSMARESGLQVLRQLEKNGEYSGFSRPWQPRTRVRKRRL